MRKITVKYFIMKYILSKTLKSGSLVVAMLFITISAMTQDVSDTQFEFNELIDVETDNVEILQSSAEIEIFHAEHIEIEDVEADDFLPEIHAEIDDTEVFEETIGYELAYQRVGMELDMLSSNYFSILSCTSNFSNRTVSINTTITGCSTLVVHNVTVNNNSKLTIISGGDVTFTEFNLVAGSELEIR